MEQGKMSPDAEKGTVVVVREPRGRGCFWQALCALALLALVALTTYTILHQMKAVPTDGDAAQSSEIAAASFQTNNDLERIVKEVGNAKRSNIAAHVTASGIIEGKEVVWQDETDSTLTEGVDFENNGLVIRTAGQYFVYAQVVFHGSSCQEKATYLSHNISSLSASYPVENLLLKAIKSICHYGPHGETWYKTCYQGAIFHFQEGDKIYSRVTERVVNLWTLLMGKPSLAYSPCEEPSKEQLGAIFRLKDNRLNGGAGSKDRKAYSCTYCLLSIVRHTMGHIVLYSSLLGIQCLV